jgi:hypothetical protein|tara:strand:+ start:93 stop:656 length:564 start_codon:yes stop_codon:yes gene_type:complete
MAKSPFKLKSGNTTPFKQMGSAPMTRNQARRLSQRHMKDGAYTTMPGESRFQMHKRLRKAGTIGETTETYLGKHQAAEAKTRAEFRTRGKESRTRFVENVQDFGKGLKKAANKIIGKVGDTVEDLNINIPGGGGGGSSSSSSIDYSTYESVNALSKERDRIREANGDETEIQKEINKRLEENPGVWD